MIVEVREPAKVLDSLENIREAVNAIYREMVSGISVMTFSHIEWVSGQLDEVIENQFEVRDE